MEHNGQQQQRREILEPHANRKIRSVVTRSDQEDPVVEALFDVVYEDIKVIDHSVAVAVGKELESTDRTVRELLDGWRPEALGGK